MRCFLSLLILLTALTAQSQQTKVVDVNADNFQTVGSLFYATGDVPISTVKYVKVVEGTPYFIESWTKATLVMDKGRTYENIRVRLDLLENSLQYIAPDGTEMTATTPVKNVTLRDSLTGKEYRFIYSSFLEDAKTIPTGWYQLLGSGQATLYKSYEKRILENKPYGSATVEQTILTTEQYYIFTNSVFTRIKKIKELSGLLKDKKDELDKYIISKKLSGKTDGDYSELVAYYNSLVTK